MVADSPVSASAFAWAAAGSPLPVFPRQACQTNCATCGSAIDFGIPLTAIETPTTSNHGDFFRFGTTHVCPACGWLFGAGKGRPGNYLATPGRFVSTVISMDSVVKSKQPWAVLLVEIANLPPDTLCTGVMTTDVKPRLWPRARLGTVGNFGLYVHCPDYDVSEWRNFSLSECLDLISFIRPILAAGFSKASLWYGLFRDCARVAKAIDAAWVWERNLIHMRASPAFLPALIAAGVKIGEFHGQRH